VSAREVCGWISLVSSTATTHNCLIVLSSLRSNTKTNMSKIQGCCKWFSNQSKCYDAIGCAAALIPATLGCRSVKVIAVITGLLVIFKVAYDALLSNTTIRGVRFYHPRRYQGGYLCSPNFDRRCRGQISHVGKQEWRRRHAYDPTMTIIHQLMFRSVSNYIFRICATFYLKGRGNRSRI
jgi:hypothetical protein